MGVLLLGFVNAESSCGNGVIETGEQCESNNVSLCGQAGYWACKGCQCMEKTLDCGDGIIQSGEQCESSSDCSSNKICESCQCTSPPIDYNCEKILNGGDASKKINLFFMDENYNGRQSVFNSDVLKYINGEPENNKKGFFNVAPFDELKDRFNVYRLNSNGQESECSPNTACSNQIIVDSILLSCGLQKNLNKNRIFISVLDGENDVAKANEENILVLTGTSASSTRELRQGSLLHEVGHLFGFGEEYIDVYIPQPRTTYPPNLDSKGCPKWCSGSLNQKATCYQRYLNYQSCVNNISGPTKDHEAEWRACYQNEYDYYIPCNLGLNCRDDSGCWFGGESISDWRAYEKDIMAGGFYLNQGYGYGKINEEFLRNKVLSLTEGNQPPQNQNCSDSDNGLNPNVKGKTTAFGYEYIDHCARGGESSPWSDGIAKIGDIIEYACSDNNNAPLCGTTYCHYKVLKCPEGQSCVDGVCGVPVIEFQGACVDKDGGQNYYDKGLTAWKVESGDYNKEEDYCLDSNTVSEGYCLSDVDENGKAYRRAPYYCENGCQDGACIRSQLNPTTQPITLPEDSTNNELQLKSYICNGCELENKCFPFGYRKEGKFCTESQDFKIQSDENSICENNFECKTNICIDGICISSSLWQKFLSWFRKLFGGK